MSTELNSGNLIKAINTWAVPVIRYTAGIIKWNKNEVDEIDRKTRKLLSIFEFFNINSDVDRLYVKRGEGGKGLIEVRQMIKEEELAINEYINSEKDSFMKLVKDERTPKEQPSRKDFTKNYLYDRKLKYKNKVLHGQYERNTCEIIDKPSTYKWLKLGFLKKQTESLIMAAQEQALRTNKIKVSIDRKKISPLCRMCNEKDETVDHIVSSCKNLASIEYLNRHNKVAQYLHHHLLKQNNFNVKDKWYEHQPESIVENNTAKILWDFNIYTDKVIRARRPDIVVIDKTKNEVKIIDVAIPGDSRIREKETEKLDKYHDLKIELQRIWKTKVTIIPIVIGALGAFSKKANIYIKTLKINIKGQENMQKAALLGTARILRKVLGS